MLVNAHLHMKDLLDIRDRPVHIQQNMIGMRAGHSQPVGFRERDDRLIILLCRTKLFCELFRRQVVTVLGACRIVDLMEQARERFLVAQRQPNCQMQTGFAWETANRLQVQARYGTRHVAKEDLPILRACRWCEQENQTRQPQAQKAPLISQKFHTNPVPYTLLGGDFQWKRPSAPGRNAPFYPAEGGCSGFNSYQLRPHHHRESDSLAGGLCP